MADFTNPYRAGPPLGPTNQGVFVGREDVLGALRQFVNGDSRGVHLVQGLRRIGKTSVLSRLAADIEPGTPHAFIDLLDYQGKTVSVRQFTLDLASRLFRSVDQVPPDQGWPTIDKFLADGIGSLLEKSQRAPVLIFDELEALDTLENQDDTETMSAGYFYSLCDSNNNPARIVVSFGRPITAFSSKKLAPLKSIFKSAVSHRVGLLSDDEAGRLIEEPTRGLIDWTAVQRTYLQQISGNHPMLLQAVLSEIVEAELRGQSIVDKSDAEAIDALVEKVAQRYDSQINWALLGFSLEQVILLHAISSQSPDGRTGEVVSDIDLDRALKERIEPTGQTNTQQFWETHHPYLADWGIITQGEAGGWRIKANLLSHYLRGKPLQKLLAETFAPTQQADVDAAAEAANAGRPDVAVEIYRRLIDENPYRKDLRRLIVNLLVQMNRPLAEIVDLAHPIISEPMTAKRVMEAVESKLSVSKSLSGDLAGAREWLRSIEVSDSSLKETRNRLLDELQKVRGIALGMVGSLVLIVAGLPGIFAWAFFQSPTVIPARLADAFVKTPIPLATTIEAIPTGGIVVGDKFGGLHQFDQNGEVVWTSYQQAKSSPLYPSDNPQSPENLWYSHESAVGNSGNLVPRDNIVSVWQARKDRGPKLVRKVRYSGLGAIADGNVAFLDASTNAIQIRNLVTGNTKKTIPVEGGVDPRIRENRLYWDTSAENIVLTTNGRVRIYNLERGDLAATLDLRDFVTTPLFQKLREHPSSRAIVSRINNLPNELAHRLTEDPVTVAFDPESERVVLYESTYTRPIHPTFVIVLDQADADVGAGADGSFDITAARAFPGGVRGVTFIDPNQILIATDSAGVELWDVLSNTSDILVAAPSGKEKSSFDQGMTLIVGRKLVKAVAFTGDWEHWLIDITGRRSQKTLGFSGCLGGVRRISSPLRRHYIIEGEPPFVIPHRDDRSANYSWRNCPASRIRVTPDGDSAFIYKGRERFSLEKGFVVEQGLGTDQNGGGSRRIEMAEDVISLNGQPHAVTLFSRESRKLHSLRHELTETLPLETAMRNNSRIRFLDSHDMVIAVMAGDFWEKDDNDGILAWRRQGGHWIPITNWPQPVLDLLESERGVHGITAGSKENLLFLWNGITIVELTDRAEITAQISLLERDDPGRFGPGFSRALLANGDGRLVALWRNNDVAVIDVVSHELAAHIRRHASRVTALSFIGSNILASADLDGAIILTDLKTGRSRALETTAIWPDDDRAKPIRWLQWRDEEKDLLFANDPVDDDDNDRAFATWIRRLAIRKPIEFDAVATIAEWIQGGTVAEPVERPETN